MKMGRVLSVWDMATAVAPMYLSGGEGGGAAFHSVKKYLDDASGPQNAYKAGEKRGWHGQRGPSSTHLEVASRITATRVDKRSHASCPRGWRS